MLSAKRDLCYMWPEKELDEQEEEEEVEEMKEDFQVWVQEGV